MYNKSGVCFRIALVSSTLTALLFVSGCVSEKIEPAYIPRVAASDNGQGIVTLSWQTKTGYDYQIYIRDDTAQLWRPMANSKIYHGTGGTIYVELTHDPKEPTPWYSVRAKTTADR